MSMLVLQNGCGVSGRSGTSGPSAVRRGREQSRSREKRDLARATRVYQTLPAAARESATPASASGLAIYTAPLVAEDRLAQRSAPGLACKYGRLISLADSLADDCSRRIGRKCACLPGDRQRQGLHPRKRSMLSTVSTEYRYTYSSSSIHR
jgi:hypothetical protein